MGWFTADNATNNDTAINTVGKALVTICNHVSIKTLAHLIFQLHGTLAASCSLALCYKSLNANLRLVLFTQVSK
jgi:hypothetical protein